MPVSAWISVVFPWSICPAVPIIIAIRACYRTYCGIFIKILVVKEEILSNIQGKE